MREGQLSETKNARKERKRTRGSTHPLYRQKVDEHDEEEERSDPRGLVNAVIPVLNDEGGRDELDGDRYSVRKAKKEEG